MSSYVPTTWVDGVTPVDAAHQNKIEAGLTAAEIAAKKGAANGYAPLDATSKVPLANLPAVSGVDYIGNWAVGTAFKRGDVVRYNGYDYLAVNDSVGAVPPAPSVPPIVTGATYGTTLPGSPYDGQEAILVDSLTNPTYQWRFRYNAGSTSPYKWEFIGGADVNLTSSLGALQALASGWNYPGANFTAPRAGDYYAAVSAQMSDSAAGTLFQLGPAVTGLSSVAQASTLPVINGYLTFTVGCRILAVPAATVIQTAVYASTATATSGNRTLTVRPVRVA